MILWNKRSILCEGDIMNPTKQNYVEMGKMIESLIQSNRYVISDNAIISKDPDIMNAIVVYFHPPIQFDRFQIFIGDEDTEDFENEDAVYLYVEPCYSGSELIDTCIAYKIYLTDMELIRSILRLG